MKKDKLGTPYTFKAIVNHHSNVPAVGNGQCFQVTDCHYVNLYIDKVVYKTCV